MGEPVEPGGHPGALEELVPEEKAEQGVPQHILGEENLGALAPQNAGDACFWIAAMGIVDGDRAPGPQQFGVDACAPPSELASVKVRCENVLPVAGGIIDHPLQQVFGSGAIPGIAKQADQALVALRRASRAVELTGKIALARFLEKKSGLMSRSAAEVLGVLCLAGRPGQNVDGGPPVDRLRSVLKAVQNLAVVE